MQPRPSYLSVFYLKRVFLVPTRAVECLGYTEFEWENLRHILSRRRCNMLLLHAQESPITVSNATFKIIQCKKLGSRDLDGGVLN